MHHPNTARQPEAQPATGKYDIAIACRVCSIPSTTKPPIFAEDKFKLVEFCLKSLKASLGNLRAKMWVVLTGPPEYEQMFEKVWPKEDLVVLSVGRIGNPRSLQKQIDILTAQTDAELVFLAEDDYFYLPDRFQSAVEFLRSNPDANFISLYDHPDNYVIPFQQPLPAAKARKSGGLSWYSRATTTHTFLTRKATLQKCRQVYRASFWGG